jgi:hypothetical protein
MKLIAFSAIVETVAGVALAVDPSLVARLLLGSGLPAPGEAVGHIAGFGLLGFGLACWPRANATNRAAVRGLIAYDVLVAAFLAYVGFGGILVGWLLWPAVVLHAGLAVFLSFYLLSPTALR